MKATQKRLMIARGSMVVALTASAGLAQAGVYGLFPAGTSTKAAAMESGLAARGASAVLYNPANLSLTENHGTQAELGFVQATYSYEHPNYDPVEIEVRSPTAVVGYSRALSQQFAFGIIAFPAKRGDTFVPGLPKRVSDSVRPVKAKSQDQILHLGVGASYRLPLSLVAGVGLIHTRESQNLEARLVGNPNPLAEVEATTSVNRPVVGVTGEWGIVTAALNYIGGAKKTYEGKQKLASETESTDPRLTNYDPAQLGLGVGVQLGRWNTAVTVNREFWKNGAHAVRDGLNKDPLSADLRDVTERGVLVGYDVTEKANVSVGYAVLPTPWGDGRYDEATAIDKGYVLGAGFGRLDGMDRQAVSIGGNYETDSFNFGLAAYRAAGSREINAGSDNPGFYQLEVVSFSGTVEARL